MEPQRESWEERYEEKFGSTQLLNPFGSALSRRKLYQINEDMKAFIARERLLAQKEFGERILEKKKDIEWSDDYGESDGADEYVPVESIEAEMKELGI